MLQVTIDIVPYGHESARRPIATINIVNVGGDEYRGDYRYTVHGDSRTHGHEGAIYEFERARGALALVQRVLSEVL